MTEEVLERFGQARTEALCLHCPSFPISLLSAVVVGGDLEFMASGREPSLCHCCRT